GKVPLRLIRNRTPMRLTVTGAATGDAIDTATYNATYNAPATGSAGPVGTAGAAGVAMAAARPADGGDRLGLTMHPL
ncbi:peptidase S1, partial [Burkholderia sp. SIMBA_043]